MDLNLFLGIALMSISIVAFANQLGKLWYLDLRFSGSSGNRIISKGYTRVN